MLKKEKFKENAANQRKKVKDLKQEDVSLNAIENIPNQYDSKPQKLTEENLRRNEELSQKGSSINKPGKKGGSKKPMWALTQKELDEQKE